MSSTFTAITKNNPIYTSINLRQDGFIMRLSLMVCLLIMVFQQAFSQQSSKNNYTGVWETSSSWSPLWPLPETNINNSNITIQGYITANNSLSFSGSSKLTIKDTLVIKGNLTINDNNDIKIEDQGIIIVWGNLTISYDTHIDANGYFIVTGNIIKIGDVNKGEFRSNDDPVKVFVSGTIPILLTDNNNKYKALNCTDPKTSSYANSKCSYGNFADIMNSTIYPFYQTTCVTTTPTITAAGPTTFCVGGNVTLTSSPGTTYLWSNGAITRSIVVSAAGSYTVKVTDANACQSLASVPAVITVNALPATPNITAGGPTTFCAGGNVTLTSNPGTTYLWSTGATNSNINITSAGSYSVRTTNVNGCQSLASTAIPVLINTIPAAPTITAGGATTFCDGGSVSLTSSTGVTYLWSNGATTQSINAALSGNYSVKVSNASGCQSISSIATSVTVNPLPVTPVITAGGPTSFCTGGNVTLTSSTGATYLWSNGATTPSINVSLSGNYSVTTTNANGCQSAVSSSTIVTVIALPPSPTISAGGPTAFCNGGSVNLTSSVGTTYLWSNGATTQSINVTSAGSFTVKVTNANGCQSAFSAATNTVINALPIVNAGTNATIPNGTSTTLNATVTGTGPFTYSWSPSLQLVNATIEDPTTTNLSATTEYTLTAISTATTCSNTSKVTVSITGGPLSSSPTATPSTICAGSAVQLDAQPGGGSGSYISYIWTSVPAGYLSFSANPVVNPTATTIYRVAVFDGFNTVNTQVTVTVNSLPSTPTITAGGPTTFCDGGSVTLTSSLSAGSAYLWSTGATTPGINVTAAGSYTVRVTNIVSGCQSAVSTTLIVTVNALPVTPTITTSGPTNFCAGGSVTLTSSPGTIYTWSNGATTPSINATASGSYTVVVTNANGCQSAFSTATIVIVNPLPAAPTLSAGGPTIFCAGGSVTLSSSVGSTYLWSDGSTTPVINVTSSGGYTARITNINGCQSVASVPTVVTVNTLPFIPTITAGGPATFCSGGSVTLFSSAGTTFLWSNGASASGINIEESGSYTVKVTNAAGCQSASSTATIVTVNPLPITPTITAAGPTVFCEGGNVTLTSSTEANYLWSTGEITPGININASGSFTLTVTNSNGCQSQTSTATIVTVNDLPVTPVITADSPTTFCEGGSVTLSSDEESTYLWSDGETTANIDVIATGSYTVTVYNTNGCQSLPSAATAVTVNPLPATPTITAGGPTTFCEGGSVNLTSSEGTTYLWSNGSVSQSIPVTGSENYTVSVTNANGCQSAASTATLVTVNALPATPVITAGGSTIFCEGGFVTLTSGTEISYLWSNGATTPAINITASGNFSVMVTDANGCQSLSSASTAVTVNPLPGAPIISATGPTTFCEGGNVTLTSSAEADYLWTTGATSQSISVAETGSYSLMVTDVNGCQSASSAATTVAVNPLPVLPNITSGNATAFCAGDSVILVSSAETAYLWSTGETTQTVIVKSSGSYSLMVTNANGCQSATSATTTITVNPLPVIPVITAGGPTSFCIGGNVTLTSDAETNYLWSTGAVTRSITVDATGMYSVRITDANGCESELSLVSGVTVNPLPATPVIAASGPTTFCDGSSIKLTASGGISYSWSSGEAIAEITVAKEGTYTVTATDVNGCSNSAGKTITIIVTSAIAGTGGDVCGPDFSLNAVSSPGTGKWSVNSGAGIVTFLPDENNPSATAQITEYGTYNFEWKVINQSCPDSSAVTVTYHAIPVAIAGVDQLLNYTFTSNFEALLSSSETGVWSLISGSGSIDGINSPEASVSGLTVGDNLFLWEVTSEGCSASDTINIKVNDLFVPQVITPNGDQKNDFFVIKGIENNDPAELTVLNRWGRQVYYNTNYTNEWDGKTNNREELANGTYFFVLKLSDNTLTKGYVIIKR